MSSLIPKMNDENGHSQFLAQLFKNQTYLRIFLSIIESKIIFDWDNIKVSFEESANLDSKNGRIDIFLTDTTNAILIENKINAGDQEKQLERYSEWAQKQHFNFEIYYLSPYGSNPSPNGLGTLSLDKIRIISYTEHIKKWLENIVSENPENKHVKEYLDQLNKNFPNMWSSNDELLYHFFLEISKEENIAENLHYTDEPLNRSHMALLAKKSEFFLQYEYRGKEVLFIYDKAENDVFLRMSADDFSSVMGNNQQWTNVNNNYDFIVCSVKCISCSLNLALSESLKNMNKAFI